MLGTIEGRANEKRTEVLIQSIDVSSSSRLNFLVSKMLKIPRAIIVRSKTGMTVDVDGDSKGLVAAAEKKKEMLIAQTLATTSSTSRVRRGTLKQKPTE